MSDKSCPHCNGTGRETFYKGRLGCNDPNDYLVEQECELCHGDGHHPFGHLNIGDRVVMETDAQSDTIPQEAFMATFDGSGFIVGQTERKPYDGYYCMRDDRSWFPIIEKIITSYINPPIPCRSHDWIAYLERDAGEEFRTFHGETEQQAIQSLIDNYDFFEMEPK